jgi:hypothetical protein
LWQQCLAVRYHDVSNIIAPLSGNAQIYLQGFRTKTCSSLTGMARPNNRHVDTAAWFEVDAEDLMFWIERE